ncbi:MAG: hypothetical protein ACFFD4_40345, partial [Candidatus Odinarchaeota archaeon]
MKILEARMVQNRRQMEEEVRKFIDSIRTSSSVSRYELDNHLRKLGDTLLRLQQDFSTRDSIAYAKEIARRVKIAVEETTKEMEALKSLVKEKEAELTKQTQSVADAEQLAQSVNVLKNQLTMLHEENQRLTVKLQKKSEEADKYATELEDMMKTNIQVAQDIQKRDAAIEGLKKRLEGIHADYQAKQNDLIAKHKQEMVTAKQEWDLKLASAVVQQAKTAAQGEPVRIDREIAVESTKTGEYSEETASVKSDDTKSTGID